MNILRFMEEFPAESTCKAHFRNQREQEVVKCKKCSCSDHYWLKAKNQWQCKTCDFRKTLKSGSIMEGSKVDFHTWYMAMAFMTYSKKTISASELQRQLNYPKYDTVWRLMHKIRSAMGKRGALYQLEGQLSLMKDILKKPHQKSKIKERTW